METATTKIVSVNTAALQKERSAVLADAGFVSVVLGLGTMRAEAWEYFLKGVKASNDAPSQVV